MKNLHQLHELPFVVTQFQCCVKPVYWWAFWSHVRWRNFDSTMLSLHTAKLLSSRLWKRASYTNPPLIIINGSAAHTARIVLTFLQNAFMDRVISYRITQGQICRRCFSVVNASGYSRRIWPKNKVFANWSQSILKLTAEKMCRNCATRLVMASAVQLLLIVAALCTTFLNV